MSRLPGPDHSAGSWNPLRAARPLFGLILLTTILLTVAGVYAVLQMPSGIYPEVAFPRIAVIVQAAGLGPKEVEIAVTRPIEDAVSVVLGVERIRSKSMRGAAEINVTFAAGTDMVQALNDVRARVAEVQSQFPPGTSTDRRAANAFDLPDHPFRGHWRGRPGGPARIRLLRSAAADQRINDVSYVTVEGGDVREIQVEVDPQRLVAAGAFAGRCGRPAGRRAPHQDRGPDRPREPAIPGHRQHPSRQPWTWKTG